MHLFWTICYSFIYQIIIIILCLQKNNKDSRYNFQLLLFQCSLLFDFMIILFTDLLSFWFFIEILDMCCLFSSSCNRVFIFSCNSALHSVHVNPLRFSPPFYTPPRPPPKSWNFKVSMRSLYIVPKNKIHS